MCETSDEKVVFYSSVACERIRELEQENAALKSECKEQGQDYASDVETLMNECDALRAKLERAETEIKLIFNLISRYFEETK